MPRLHAIRTVCHCVVGGEWGCWDSAGGGFEQALPAASALVLHMGGQACTQLTSDACGQVLGVKPSALAVPGMAVLTNQAVVCTPDRVLAATTPVGSFDEAAAACRSDPGCSHFGFQLLGSGELASVSGMPRFCLWCDCAAGWWCGCSTCVCYGWCHSSSRGDVAAVPRDGWRACAPACNCSCHMRPCMPGFVVAVKSAR